MLKNGIQAIIPNRNTENLIEKLVWEVLMRLGIFILVIGFGLFGPVGMALGHMPLEESERREVLAGIKEIAVVINHGLSRGGMLHAELQELVVERLLQNGLVVISEGNQGEDSYKKPALCIDIAILKNEPSNYSFLINARFNETVALLRDSQRFVFATTWTRTRMGIGDQGVIKEEIGNILDFFLIDYRASNDSMAGS